LKLFTETLFLKSHSFNTNPPKRTLECGMNGAIHVALIASTMPEYQSKPDAVCEIWPAIYNASLFAAAARPAGYFTCKQNAGSYLSAEIKSNKIATRTTTKTC
jgi:hypothetical protein